MTVLDKLQDLEKQRDPENSFTYPSVPPSMNLGGWTVGHHHHCVHCKQLGPIAVHDTNGHKSGHPYGQGYDAYRHECPVCLQFWFSNDWSGDSVPESKDLKVVYVPNPGRSIIRGSRGIPIWMLPPRARRI
jgi:hypothetical protein